MEVVINIIILLCWFALSINIGVYIGNIVYQKNYEEMELEMELKMEPKIEEEVQKRSSQVYYLGYLAGQKDVCHKVLEQKFTPNMLRKYFGLPTTDEVDDTTEEQDND